jgi:hypothetical protein
MKNLKNLSMKTENWKLKINKNEKYIKLKILIIWKNRKLNIEKYIINI